MADPRNIAHDKKVMEEKKHHGEAPVPAAEKTPQPGKKPHLVEEEKGESNTYQQHAHHDKAAEEAE